MDLVLSDMKHKRAIAQLDAGDVSQHVFGAETLRLLAHVFDQLRTLDSVGEPGEILDQRGDRELAARLVAFDHKRFEVRARSVQCSRVSRAAGTNDDDVANIHKYRYVRLRNHEFGAWHLSDAAIYS